jgi:hypothetical protein
MALRKRLKSVLHKELQEFIQKHNSLALASQTTEAFENVSETLRQIPQQSLLTPLCNGELLRLTERIALLRNRRYQLRNERPIPEIVAYYSSYLESLHGPEGGFDAMSCYEFWNDFSQGGKNDDYTNANIKAAENGAAIRRIFLVDKHRFAKPEDDYAVVFRRIISKHYDLTLRLRPLIQLKILETSEYQIDVTERYENFGILKSGEEKLLMRPDYLWKQTPKMNGTQFFYDSGDANVRLMTRDIRAKVQKYAKRFEEAWSQAREIALADMEVDSIQ